MGSAVSPWWSVALTGIGLIGLALVYRRPRSIIGPAIGVAVQPLWVAYTVATGQWGFLASAAAYATINAYGIRTRVRAPRPPQDGGSAASGTDSAYYARFWNAVAGTLNSYCIRHGHPRPLFSERNQFVLKAWRALHPDTPLPGNAITPRRPPAGGAGEAPARRAHGSPTPRGGCNAPLRVDECTLSPRLGWQCTRTDPAHLATDAHRHRTGLIRTVPADPAIQTPANGWHTTTIDPRHTERP